jgi:hypothetical protein
VIERLVGRRWRLEIMRVDNEGAAAQPDGRGVLAGAAAEFPEPLEHAAQQRTTASMALSLAQAAERVGRVLVEFDTLAVRTANPMR